MIWRENEMEGVIEKRRGRERDRMKREMYKGEEIQRERERER